MHNEPALLVRKIALLEQSPSPQRTLKVQEGGATRGHTINGIGSPTAILTALNWHVAKKRDHFLLDGRFARTRIVIPGPSGTGGIQFAYTMGK